MTKCSGRKSGAGGEGVQRCGQDEEAGTPSLLPVLLLTQLVTYPELQFPQQEFPAWPPEEGFLICLLSIY